MVTKKAWCDPVPYRLDNHITKTQGQACRTLYDDPQTCQLPYQLGLLDDQWMHLLFISIAFLNPCQSTARFMGPMWSGASGIPRILDGQSIGETICTHVHTFGGTIRTRVRSMLRYEKKEISRSPKNIDDYPVERSQMPTELFNNG